MMPDVPGSNSETMTPLEARRAIEAVRAGVPSRAAVMFLGTNGHDIEERFRGQLSAAQESGTEGFQPAGFMVAGDFGSGKSHLLEYLKQVALDEGFVVSKVVISKETPLFDPSKLYRAAVDSAVVPGRRGAALAQVAAQLDPNSEEYASFYRWVQSAGCGLSQRFAATLLLYQRVRDQDVELADSIVEFWAGEAFPTAPVRAGLKELHEQLTYHFERIDAASLARQRFRFATQLMLAAGYKGWVLLVDEVELIARYSLRQRARSYVEIAGWTGNLRAETYPGIIAILAITSDFERAVLDDRNDRDLVPAKLRTSPREADQLIARDAERGMRLIGKSLKLAAPNRQFIDATYERLRTMHGLAYDWEPPSIDPGERLASSRVRQYVRRWTNEWDLRRLYPDYQPDIQVEGLTPAYSEDLTLEQPMEGSVDPPDTGIREP